MPHIKQYFHKQQKKKKEKKEKKTTQNKTLLSVGWSQVFISMIIGSSYQFELQDIFTLNRMKIGRKMVQVNHFTFHVSIFQFPHEIVEMFLPPGV